MIGAASLAARRSGALPRWLSAAGIAVAVVFVVGFTFAYALQGLLFLWTAVVSAVLFHRSRNTADYIDRGD